MTTTKPTSLDELIAKAHDEKRECWEPKSHDYKEARPVHNDRLQKCPALIVPCRDAEDVQWWFQNLEHVGVRVSIRSGGHHHEAMCSNDDGVVLMAPSGDGIDIDTVNNTVWVHSGLRLRAVIAALGAKHRLLPTGGCDTVNVGGLTHGGGWGLSTRQFGLTSDALLAVEMVLPNGDIVMLDQTGFLEGTTTTLSVDPVDLFWAIRGGGGGNFGMVTKFKFQIFDPPNAYTAFTLQWDKESRLDAAVAWAELCRLGDKALNTFARMAVVEEGPHYVFYNNPHFMVGGRYYGTEEQCRYALTALMEKAKPEFCFFSEQKLDNPISFFDNHMAGVDTPPPLPDDAKIENAGDAVMSPQGYALQVGARTKLGPPSTCVSTPEPHKVSSTFPDTDDDAAIFVAAAEYLDAYEDPDGQFDGTNLYLSLHGMGGRMAEFDDSKGAFPWRDKPYMLQVQAWWLPDYKTKEQEEEVLAWVRGFRERLEKHCTGAFINFPDSEQDITQYYGASWGRLGVIKAQVDPNNLLAFDMGIDPIFVDA